MQLATTSRNFDVKVKAMKPCISELADGAVVMHSGNCPGCLPRGCTQRCKLCESLHQALDECLAKGKRRVLTIAEAERRVAQPCLTEADSRSLTDVLKVGAGPAAAPYFVEQDLSELKWTIRRKLFEHNFYERPHYCDVVVVVVVVLVAAIVAVVG